MDQKLKSLWLEALRSGEYTQAQSHLFDGEGFCCLGVLADVCLKNDMVPKGVEIQRNETSMRIGHKFSAHYSSGYLGRDNEVAPKFGLTQKQAKALAQMNDEGRTFAKIAREIEEKV